ncbi:Sec-independent protein translocase protein TatB [Novispirillum sp. DQ9]|uniref:Sec-independent protein translocase protein TatB n=1 Tax=Novispirillum sp. DQ9 TaxID=3398612 RepID=UPI003C7B4AA0
MFDLGWSEIALIAVLAVIVLGPKELPTAMRTVARWVRKARSLAGDFQRHLDEVVKEADLDDLRQEARRIAHTDIGREIDKAVDPDGTAARSLSIDSSTAAPPAASGPTLSLDDRIDPTGPAGSSAPAAPVPADTKPKD